MNVTETKADGLSREFKVQIPKGDLAEKLTARITEIQPQVNLKGFRKGKVPASHIKKMFGKSLMAEIVQDLVKTSSSQALEEKSLRPASQPHVHMDADEEQVVAGEADLEYHMHVDIMPDFEPADMTGVKLERLVAEPEEEQMTEALQRIAESNKSYEDKGDGAKAEDGDAVVIDFLGKIDGEAFDGGAAEGHTLVLGEGRFIPGFEDQLIGTKAGDEKDVNVTFPEDYQVDTLKGKPAVFEVKVHEVKSPKTPEIDDEFAKSLGLEGLDKLKEALSSQLEGELNNASRQVIKRSLLDALDERHEFELPPKMVEAEFDQIWKQFEAEKEADRLSDEDKEKSEDDLKSEYRKIAERRVRLGLVLAEIGQKAEIEITNDELVQALRMEASRYPGQEQMVIDFYRNNPAQMAQLRAPIFEEKVVDYIIAKADVTEKKVSREELLKEIEDE